MQRRLLSTTMLAACVAWALTGCVFVPGLVEASSTAESAPAVTDSTEPVEATAPAETEPAETETVESTEPVEPSESNDAEAEWPAEVPVPEGKRYPSEDDPLFYMVDGDDAAYAAYLEELEAAGFESTMESETISSWEGHGYDVLVMNLAGLITVSVSEA